MSHFVSYFMPLFAPSLLGLGIPLGDTTTFHLVPKAPETTGGRGKDGNDEGVGCRCICC